MPQRYEDFDRAAIVTGADPGIGRACAVALAGAGPHIGITWYGAESTVAEVRPTGRRCEVAAVVAPLGPPTRGARSRLVR